MLRNDLGRALSRWVAAGLIDASTAEAVRAWESSQAASRSLGHARIADASAYLGVSIVTAAVLILLTTPFGDDFGRQLGLTFAASGAAIAVSWLAVRRGAPVLSDACAGAGVVLFVAALLVLADELVEGGDAAAGWLIGCAAAALVSAVLAWQVRSRLAAGLTAAALAAAPAALAVAEGADASDPFDGELSALAAWETLALVWLMALSVYWLSRRWLSELARWQILGASLTAACVTAGLAGVSESVVIDWASLLGALLVTGVMLFWGRIELAPSSVVLIIAAAAGALTDLEEAARAALALVLLVLSLAAVHPQVMRRLATHWLAPAWEGALWLTAMVVAAVAAGSLGWLAAAGIVWALTLAAAGVFLERRLAFVLGVIGVYAAGLTLIVGEFEGSSAAGFGTLAFGLLVVAAGIVWRRRFGRRLTGGRLEA